MKNVPGEPLKQLMLLSYKGRAIMGGIKNQRLRIRN